MDRGRVKTVMEVTSHNCDQSMNTRYICIHHGIRSQVAEGVVGDLFDRVANIRLTAFNRKDQYVDK